MGENPRFLVVFGILLLAFAMSVVMLVCITIQAHASTEPVPSRPVVHITDDPGGNVAAYYKKYKALSDAGAELHFHGGCFSSCTMVLFTDFNGIRACADEGAIFGFHKPFAQVNGKVMRTKRAVRETRKLWTAWLEELPYPLRRYLQKARVPSATEGDETNVMLILPANLLLPKCAMTVAAQ